MKSKYLYKYFINLENGKCQKKGNFIIRNDENFTQFNGNYFMYTARINNVPFYLKPIGEQNELIQPIASSQLLKHVGIATPPIFVTNDYDDFFATTQDIQNLPINTIIASKITTSDQYNIHRKMSKATDFPSYWLEKWRFIKDYKHLFLEFMTPECFDEFVSMFLIDEIRTEQDCHDDNYFLWKRPNSDKYEGIIRFDLDNVFITNGYVTSIDDFKDFLEQEYFSYDPFLHKDWKSYTDRHNDLRELLNEDILSNNNIVVLRNALEFDLPQTIKTIGKKYNMEENEINKIYTPIAMLWEYNRKHLGKDLEI